MPLAVALLVILTIGFVLRFQSVAHSVVDNPMRADAGEYVRYAYNLKHFGVYSMSNTLSSRTQIAPRPDAVRAPLYPLFIVPFLNEPPTFGDLRDVTYGQMLVSLITIVAVFWLARLILPLWFAVAATALTAASPHLVNMNIYLLSETLFCFLLVVGMLFVAKSVQAAGWKYSALGGLLLAAAALTHPMLLYFVLPLAGFWFISLGWGGGHKKIIALLVGFSLLYGAWIGRNLISLRTFGDNSLMLVTIRSGAYPGLMYQNDPATYGYPTQEDPDFSATSKDLPSVMAEVARSFRDAPFTQLRWYLIGKPIELWSWSNRAQGQGDVFIYPTPRTPYTYLPHFRALHGLMKWTHELWVLLMAAAVVVCWIPRAVAGLPKGVVYGARAISLLLLYHAAVMIAGFPLPRYSIPLLPFLYLMAMFALALGMNRFLPKSASSTFPSLTRPPPAPAASSCSPRPATIYPAALSSDGHQCLRVRRRRKRSGFFVAAGQRAQRGLILIKSRCVRGYYPVGSTDKEVGNGSIAARHGSGHGSVAPSACSRHSHCRGARRLRGGPDGSGPRCARRRAPRRRADCRRDALAERASGPSRYGACPRYSGDRARHLGKGSPGP